MSTTYDNKWSPFDPKWYQLAFERFTCAADDLFNTNTIIEQGYDIPDVDGSRSSIFRREAILSNSFNEGALRETLKDIYLQSSHRLIASNHDNVHFYKWHGNMSDMEIIPNTEYCQFTIPTETFITPNERDLFKRSQYYRKWIPVEDILNNWNIFKWHCMLFINQRIYSEYQLRIDDHEVAIKFKYYDRWISKDLPVYIYKFDTRAQSRIHITRELCINQWDWKIPLDYINDKRVANSTNVIVAFNKISDESIRTNGITDVEVLGDNLEFLKVEDGYIDISNISAFNKEYIQSELTQYLAMSIIVPRFFHEYPIILPTESIYQPYEPDFQKVYTLEYDRSKSVNTLISPDDDHYQVYVDVKGGLLDSFDAWKTMIRPIVLSDAYDTPFNEPSQAYLSELDELKRLTVIGADVLESFRLYMDATKDDIDFNTYLDRLIDTINNIRDAQTAFFDKLQIQNDETYERIYKKFIQLLPTLREDTIYSDWFHNISRDDDVSYGKNFWTLMSPLIYIPQEIIDKYYVARLVKSIGNKHILWDTVNDKLGTIRFRRPIEESDFWTFEYNVDDKVWRPYPLSVKHHFPDVYTLSDDTESTPTANRIFKTFFFYSDTMDVRNQSGDIRRATPDWISDMDEYMYDRGAVYRDIFMEKFYWMGIQSIYNHIHDIKSRWEVIEYVIDNPSYERFNQLFLNTMDPYFKLGLATYLKGDNYQFPFDDAIDKMNEAMTQQWNDYKKITNFEMYLNKTWIPSYFDTIIDILDDWDYGNRLIKRPRNSFDIDRLLPIMKKVQSDTFDAVSVIKDDISWILYKLSYEEYNLDVSLIEELKELSTAVYDNINEALDYTDNMDMLIYSNDNINHIIKLFNNHGRYTDEIETVINDIYNDADENNIYEHKQDIIGSLYPYLEEYTDHIVTISAMIQNFNIDEFMTAANDLNSYLDYSKNNPNDISIIGSINKFNSAWSDDVKSIRNEVFTSTVILYGTFDTTKSYSKTEVDEFISLVTTIIIGLERLRGIIERYWLLSEEDNDQELIDRFDYVETQLKTFSTNLDEFMTAREKLLQTESTIKDILDQFDEFNTSDTELYYRESIYSTEDELIAALSYIAGTNNKEYALEALTHIKRYVADWTEFLAVEQSVFERIFSISKSPALFMTNIRTNEVMMNAMIEYMDTVNIEYIPYSYTPSYSDIFVVEDVDILTGGFEHEEEDNVFIPMLGSYKVDSTYGNVSSVDSISSLGYIGTTYANPSVQSNPFDSVTSGSGVGITVKPTNVKHIRIINDEAASTYIVRIKNIIKLITDNIESPNPFSNTDLKYRLNDITDLVEDWNELLYFYSDYMTDDIKSKMYTLLDTMVRLTHESSPFIECRNNIDFAGYITEYDEFIKLYTTFITDNNLKDGNYSYYDELCQIERNKLYSLYDDGRSWTDTSELKSLVTDSKYPVMTFKSNVLSVIDIDTSLLEYKIDSLMESLNTLLSGINELPIMLFDINSILNKCNTLISELPDELYKDEWYKFDGIQICKHGRGYKAGDIVQLNPENPDDINNDTILLQITEVDDDGAVIGLKPMLDYATQYTMYGVMNTITRVGNGMNLSVECYMHQISINDSTMFMDKSSDIEYPDPFNENDLFVFQFENIHDLNVGYEVFYGGKQIKDVIIRHDKSDDIKHPSYIDKVYLNANDIMNLRNSSLYVPAEHYYIYYIDDVGIVDPGTGYSIGQEIYVDLGCINLKMKVTSLDGTPLNGIGSLEVAEGNLVQTDDNPSSENARVATDSVNNIDDEFNDGYYDRLTSIEKAAGIGLDHHRYVFTSHRFDDLDNGRRNDKFMYPDVEYSGYNNGDPDDETYLGHRIDNSIHPYTDTHRWNGIMDTVPTTDPFISDAKRVPTDKPIKGEYQSILRQRIHNSVDVLDGQSITYDPTDKSKDCMINVAMVKGDLVVPTFADLPLHTIDWPEAEIGKVVIVECDETNHNHRMAYQLRTFVISGFFVWEKPEIADMKYTKFDIDWMQYDATWGYPSMIDQYSTLSFDKYESFRDIQHQISDRYHENQYNSTYHGRSYIHNVTIKDLSVWNWTTKEWEDLSNTKRWNLEVTDYGFVLTFIKDGVYNYDMELFLNKIPDTQSRNAALKRDAVLSVKASISSEVNTAAINTLINTGRHLRIRKLLPYEQVETYRIGKELDGTPLGYEMTFRLANYMHYKNEIHLEDVKLYNRNAGRFEDIFDTRSFEIRFKDPKSTSNGTEHNTYINQCVIKDAGTGFTDGNVWAWNEDYKIHVFGHIDTSDDGKLISFTPTHCVNYPSESITLEFTVYQTTYQSKINAASIIIEFVSEDIQLVGDGYLHNVTSRMAVVPSEFKIIPLYNLDEPTIYDIIISKTSNTWTYSESTWQQSPVIHLDDYSIQQDRVYILTENGRFPLRNPSTGKSTISVEEVEDGTDVTFLNLYKRYEQLEVHTTPYPMKSVYVQRNIPSHGYIDLKGKLNKPLNKKYFEFWVNGRLLHNEVTIITPTKLFLHGLKSLKNFEIIEINRDDNEYLSDVFLTVENDDSGKPIHGWDYETYLDAALEGNLSGNNYTKSEQEYLLTPVWKQVEKDHPEFKNYPPNSDSESDILVRSSTDGSIFTDIDNASYSYVIVDTPTLENKAIVDQNLSFEHFGFLPISDSQIIDILNDIWDEEIKNNSQFNEHTIMSTNEYYGIIAKMYNENGEEVFTLNEMMYMILSDNVIKINKDIHTVQVIDRQISYDLD